MREERGLAVTVQYDHCLPEIILFAGQLLCPMLMASLDGLRRGAVGQPRRLGPEVCALERDFEEVLDDIR
jgi:hypothetical protein